MRFLARVLLNFKQPYFRQGIFLGLIFVFILGLNLRVTRFWCRAICPLGALLGIVSRWSVLGLQKNAKSCNDCNRCMMRCQGGDDPIGTEPWHKAECVLCLNCVESCPEHSLTFKFFPQGPAPVEATEPAAAQSAHGNCGRSGCDPTDAEHDGAFRRSRRAFAASARIAEGK